MDLPMHAGDAGSQRQELSGQTDRSDKFLKEQEFLAKVRETAQKIVDRMVQAIEWHRQAFGRYPESLEEAGAVAPGVPYAPWRYVCYGDHYRLSVGDPARDGWVLTYRSPVGEWQLEG
jgi:hypothetical protein